MVHATSNQQIHAIELAIATASIDSPSPIYEEGMEASDGLAAGQDAIIDLMNTTAVSGAASGDATAAEDTILPLLAKTLDDTDHFRSYVNDRGKKRLVCLWCNKECSNVTKLLCHVNKVAGEGVAICKATIPDQIKKRYFDLLERKMGARSRRNGEYILFFLCYIIIIIAFI